MRYPRWGGGRRSRPTGKMKRCRKLLEIAAESPASGARFVGQFLFTKNIVGKKKSNDKIVYSIVSAFSFDCVYFLICLPINIY